MKDKIIVVLRQIFSVILTLCMTAAFTAAVLFAVSLIIGGSTAASICALVADILLPAIYAAGAVSAFIGIAAMYIAGEEEFTLKKKSN